MRYLIPLAMHPAYWIDPEVRFETLDLAALQHPGLSSELLPDRRYENRRGGCAGQLATPLPKSSCYGAPAHCLFGQDPGKFGADLPASGALKAVHNLFV